MKRPFELVAEIQDKDVEIARLKKSLDEMGKKETYKEWERNQAELVRLKKLCGRASVALETDAVLSGDDWLILELRKAAQSSR